MIFRNVGFSFGFCTRTILMNKMEISRMLACFKGKNLHEKKNKRTTEHKTPLTSCSNIKIQTF